MRHEHFQKIIFVALWKKLENPDSILYEHNLAQFNHQYHVKVAVQSLANFSILPSHVLTFFSFTILCHDYMQLLHTIININHHPDNFYHSIYNKDKPFLLGGKMRVCNENRKFLYFIN